MKKPNHRCIICGSEYYCCNSCENMEGFIPWRRTACSIECFQTYLSYMDYKAGALTREEMRERLIDLGFKGKAVNEELQEKFDELLADEPETKKPLPSVLGWFAKVPKE